MPAPEMAQNDRSTASLSEATTLSASNGSDVDLEAGPSNEKCINKPDLRGEGSDTFAEKGPRSCDKEKEPDSHSNNKVTIGSSARSVASNTIASMRAAAAATSALTFDTTTAARQRIKSWLPEPPRQTCRDLNCRHGWVCRWQPAFYQRNKININVTVVLVTIIILVLMLPVIVSRIHPAPKDSDDPRYDTSQLVGNMGPTWAAGGRRARCIESRPSIDR